MYERYYGFEKKPFNISPDPDFLFLNATYREAMALLRYGVYEVKGIVSLIGEVGTGKTTLLNELLQSLDDQVTALAIPSTRFSYDDLIDYLLARLDVSDVADRSISRFEMLRTHLEAMANRGESVVILVDEAQTLDRATLESLRLLSNVETPKRKLLPIILVGQPELQEKLDAPELRQFKQRIVVSFRLRPLSYDEVPQYIAHRLKSAGYVHGLTLFSDEAVRMVAAYTGGIPRLVNALCDNALLSGYAQNRQYIDVPMIEEAANDLLLDKAKGYSPPPETDAPVTTPQQPVFRGKPKFHFLWAWTAVAMLAVIVGGYVALSHWGQFGTSSLSDRALEAADVAVQSAVRRLSSVDGSDVKTEHLSMVRATTSTGKIPDKPVTMTSAAPVFGETRTKEKKGVKEVPSSTRVKGAEYSSLANVHRPSVKTTSADLGASAAPPSSKLSDEANPALLINETQTGSVESSGERLSPHDPLHGRESIVPSDGARAAVEAVDGNSHRPEVMGGGGQPPGGDVLVTEKESPEKRGTTRTIKQGQTISSIARELYGHVRLYELALIHAANPAIKNLDVVFVGQNVFFPDHAQEIIVFNQDKGSYGIVLGAARSQATIKKWQADLVAKGIASNIVPVRLSNTIRAYRLETGEFKDENLAVREAGVLRPSLEMTIAASMEERL